jgi:hypothetical protein
MKYVFLECLTPHVDSEVFINEEFQKSLMLAFAETVVGPHALSLLIVIMEEHHRRVAQKADVSHKNVFKRRILTLMISMIMLGRTLGSV